MLNIVENFFWNEIRNQKEIIFEMKNKIFDIRYIFKYFEFTQNVKVNSFNVKYDCRKFF